MNYLLITSIIYTTCLILKIGRVDRLRIPNIIGGAIVILIGALFYALTFDFPNFSMQETGPEFLPRIYSVLLIILGLLTIVQGIRDKSKSDDGENNIGFSIILMGAVL